jgi:hypothetical protein
MQSIFAIVGVAMYVMATFLTLTKMVTEAHATDYYSTVTVDA